MTLFPEVSEIVTVSPLPTPCGCIVSTPLAIVSYTSAVFEETALNDVLPLDSLIAMPALFVPLTSEYVDVAGESEITGALVTDRGKVTTGGAASARGAATMSDSVASKTAMRAFNRNSLKASSASYC